MKSIHMNDKITLIYNRLYEIGKSINETVEIEALYTIACDFATNELNFEKAIIFEHDDTNGWFKVVKSTGYETPKDKQILKIISLLLSGEVIEYLRVKGKPMIHTEEQPKNEVQSLLKSLFLKEAYLELFGGDREIPHGLIIVGNGMGDTSGYSRLLQDSLIMMALGNFMVQLSNTINTIIFYKAWQNEKENLEEKILQRTRQIEEQKNELETIFQTTKDGVAILDLKSNFLDFNDAYLELTGCTREDLLNTSCVALSTPEYVEKSKTIMAETIEKGHVKNFEKEFVKKDGSKVIINMTLSLLPDKQRVVISSKDITELKQKEHLLLEQSKLAQMGEMINMIAHQWRQPLNAISASAINLSFQNELGLSSKESITESCRFIQREAKHMSGIIDDFMEFNRSESNKKFHVGEAVDEVAKIVTSQLKSRAIQLQSAIDADAQVYHNVKSIEHVLLNLVMNARDAFEEKKEIADKRITISTQSDEASTSITVEDNAGGIPEDIIDKVFNPYFTTKEQGTGTGVGLYMSKKMIESVSGATISVSNSTHGALFVIRVPKEPKR